MHHGDVTDFMVKVLLHSMELGLSRGEITDHKRLLCTTWDLLEHNWSVALNMRTHLDLTVHKPTPPGDFTFGTTITLRKGLILQDTNRVIGLSPKLRPSERLVDGLEDLVLHPERYKDQLPALSVYGVPWEIAWIRSRKPRWEAIRSYRRARDA
jgi:hypothetical protein